MTWIYKGMWYCIYACRRLMVHAVNTWALYQLGELTKTYWQDSLRNGSLTCRNHFYSFVMLTTIHKPGFHIIIVHHWVNKRGYVSGVKLTITPSKRCEVRGAPSLPLHLKLGSTDMTCTNLQHLQQGSMFALIDWRHLNTNIKDRENTQRKKLQRQTRQPFKDVTEMQ